MPINRRNFITLGAAGFAGFAASRRARALVQAAGPQFELVQPDLFNVAGGQPNCWADFNNDGHLDLFVGFKDAIANRVYRYGGARFADVAAGLALAALTATRAAALGDFDSGGHLDLHAGLPRRSGRAHTLY